MKNGACISIKLGELQTLGVRTRRVKLFVREKYVIPYYGTALTVAPDQYSESRI